MGRWRAGDVLALSTGITLVAAALLPWAQFEGVSLGALVLGLYEPLAVVLAIAAALVLAAARHTIWAALVAFASAFGITITLLSIHADLYGALASFGGVAARVDPGHATGLGLSVMFAAGLLSGVAGVVIAIQSAPPVQTHYDPEVATEK